jgi:N6-L-threonylcarbamoyladenine synthase
MYGALLEKFAFSDEATMDLGKKVTSPEIVTSGRQRYDMEDSSAAEYQAMYAPCFAYNVPRDEQQALSQNTTKWGWSLNQPLLKAGGGQKIKSLDMSFSGLMTNVERVVRFKRDAVTGKSTRVERLPADITMEERRDIARETMRAAFEHVASRVVLSLRQISANTSESASVQTVIMSGGVAANAYLRYILASTLVAFGYPTIRLVFPPPSLCTDNAAMIAWAGIEMYQAGHKDPRTIRAIRKWPLDRLLSPPDPNSLGNRNG